MKMGLNLSMAQQIEVGQGLASGCMASATLIADNPSFKDYN